jgi:hypothetical protein
MANVEGYFDSDLTADDVMAFGFAHVAVATGSTWRRDGVARTLLEPIPIADKAEVLTPDDLMAGGRPSGKRVMLYDDDHYYMGAVLAELLAKEDYQVTLVTPAGDVSNWTDPGAGLYPDPHARARRRDSPPSQRSRPAGGRGGRVLRLHRAQTGDRGRCSGSRDRALA